MGIHVERVKSEYAGRALPKFNINADSTTKMRWSMFWRGRKSLPTGGCVLLPVLFVFCFCPDWAWF